MKGMAFFLLLFAPVLAGLVVQLPSNVSAIAGKQSVINLKTSSDSQGSIFVRITGGEPDWFGEFSCSTFCNNRLVFTPKKGGDYNLTFEIIVAGSGEKISRNVGVLVLDQSDEFEKAKKDLRVKLDIVFAKIQSLQQKGISLPVALEIFRKANSANPATLSEINELSLELDTALEHIINAERTGFEQEEREIPFFQILGGGIALIIGVFAFVYLIILPSRPVEDYRKGFSWKGVLLPLGVRKK